MWWSEDMNMTPVLAVWDGKSYGDILSGPDLEPFVDDILNELEVGYTKIVPVGQYHTKKKKKN